MGAAGALIGTNVPYIWLVFFFDATEEWIRETGKELQKSRGTRKPKIGRRLVANAKPIAERVKAAVKTRSQTRNVPPIFLDVESLWPGPYSVDVTKLASDPHLVDLTYAKKTPEVKDKLRRDLKNIYGPLQYPGTWPTRPGGQFHEYPFNATREAGVATSYGEWVDSYQNGLQGTYFQWFIDNRLGSVDGTEFLVVPIPAADTPFQTS